MDCRGRKSTIASDEWSNSPWRRMLDLLTPLSPEIGYGNRSLPSSTIESILTAAGLADIPSSLNGGTLTKEWLNGDKLPNGGKTRMLEMIVSSVIADDISRLTSHRVFDTDGPFSEWSLAAYSPLTDFNQRILKGQNALQIPDVPSSDLTTVHARMLITGYAYRITLAGYLSMVVLFTHMLMVIAHIMWVIYYKRASRSWKSISELIALSQNSQAAFWSLANTGAGIGSSRTFTRVAKICVKTQPGSPDRDHFELIFEDFKESVSTANVNDAVSLMSATREARSGSTLEEPRTVNHERASWTFPLDHGRPYAHGDMELESRSSATDRLISQVHLTDGEKGRLVRVNQAYA